MMSESETPVINPGGKAGTFAIAVPVRSHVDQLVLTLESLAAQGGLATVALLDASGNPRVQDIARPYQDMISYAYHRAADDGQAAAIQEGWNRVPGDYVGWLNDDDHLLPGALDRVRQAFEQNPDIDVVYGDAVYVGSDGAFQTYFPSIADDVADIRFRDVICQPSCFVRRQAMSGIGGLNTDLQYVMDWDFWVRLHEVGSRFHRLSGPPLSVVCNHLATKTNTGGRARQREIAALQAGHRRAADRLRTWVGVRRVDAMSSGRRGLSRLLGLMLALRRLIAGRRASVPQLFGLGAGTNRVLHSCVVYLSWYRAAEPRKISLIADREGQYSLAQGAARWQLQKCGRADADAWGGRCSGWRYDAEISQPIDPVAGLELTGPGNGWRLVSFSVE